MIDAAIRPECRNEVMLLGRLYDPEGAVRVGIAHEIAPVDGLEAATARIGAEAAALPTRAYAGNKRMLRRSAAEHSASLVMDEMGAGFARQSR
jgi:enoyl-CoA hydratase/carnithine racemase